MLYLLVQCMCTLCVWRTLKGSKDVFAADLDHRSPSGPLRSAIVDSSGREINSNRYIALQAAVVLRSHPGTTIVTDSVTSNGLTKFITDLGGKHFRWVAAWEGVSISGILGEILSDVGGCISCLHFWRGDSRFSKESWHQGPHLFTHHHLCFRVEACCHAVGHT